MEIQKIQTLEGDVFTNDRAVTEFFKSVHDDAEILNVKILEDFAIEDISTSFNSLTGYALIFGVDIFFEWDIQYEYDDIVYTVDCFPENKFSTLVSDALKECISERMYADGLHNEQYLSTLDDGSCF